MQALLFLWVLIVGGTLPQANMEAHRGPHVEENRLRRALLHFHVNLGKRMCSCSNLKAWSVSVEGPFV